jgi:hypothetical protein
MVLGTGEETSDMDRPSRWPVLVVTGLAFLATGWVAVTVFGVLNMRLNEIVRVTSINVSTLPHGKGKPRP